MVSPTKRPQPKQNTMANSCDVEMTIVGKREGLLKIADLIDQLNEKVKELNNNGNPVYYDMVILGDMIGCSDNVSRRGCFYDPDPDRLREEIEENMGDDDYSQFDLSYEGAWAEQSDFHDYLEGKFKDYDVHCHFRATELGCDYCVKNSELYPEDYLVDGYTDKYCAMELCFDIIKAADSIESFGVEIEHKSREEYDKMELGDQLRYKNRLEKIINGKLEEYNQKAEDEGSDNYIYLHKYEYVG